MARGKGHCPNCGADRWAEIEAELKHTDDIDDHVSCDYVHRILRCGGCDRIYFQTSVWFSEDGPDDDPKVAHWPTPQRRKLPPWLHMLMGTDYLLYNTIVETNVALNEGLNILAAIGIRTIFDRATELLGVDSGLSFAKKLDALVATGKIGGEERQLLEALTEAGSAAAHRGWRPKPEQLDTMFDAIEAFVHRNFFVLKAAEELALDVPPRPPRR